MDINVVKRGEAIFRGNLYRGSLKDGLVISVWAHRSIEDLLSEWGRGEVNPITKYGRGWTPFEGNNLDAYSLYHNPGPLPCSGGHVYTLDHLGNALTEIVPDPQRGHVEATNMSFLRLKGISDGAGVKFIIRGVYTVDAIRQTGERIQEAAKSFFVSFLRPIDLTVVVSTQELSK